MNKQYLETLAANSHHHDENTSFEQMDAHIYTEPGYLLESFTNINNLS